MKNYKQLGSLLFFTLITIFSNTVFGKGEIKDSIVISGKIGPKSYIPDGSIFEVSVVKNNTYFNWIGYNKLYKAKIKDGIFRIIIPTEEDITYAFFNLELPNKLRENMNEGNSLSLPYLLENGDEISIKLNRLNKLGDLIEYSGKGSQKLNCQQQIYQLKNSLPLGAQTRSGQLMNDMNQNSLRASTKFRELNLQMKLAILQTYRDSISKAAFDLIYYDCLGLKLQSQLTEVTTISFRKDYLKVRPVVEKYVSESFVQYNSNDSSNRSLVLSAFYPMALYDKIRLQQKLQSDTSNYDFKPVYESIKKGYSGLLRDKLWLTAVVQLVKFRHTEDYVDSILTQMGNNESKRILLDWKKINSKGSKAYPFRLQDEKGKNYVLNDFKGKVILIDFWFNGCTGCRSIVKLLSPIAQRYKENNKIVFLSVNVDQYKDWWEAGLKEGGYSILGSLHLWTRGESIASNAFLKYYNYSSFPQLLMINKNGKIISSAAPDPRMDKGIALIKMIDDNIN